MENNKKRISARTVHGVEHHAQTAVAQCLYVEKSDDVVQKLVERVDHVFDVAKLYLPVKIGFGNLGNFCNELFEKLGGFKRRVAAFVYDELNAVVLGRIVGRGDFNAVMQFLVLDRVHNKRRWRGATDKPDLYAVSSKQLGDPFGGLFRKKTAVISDNHRLVFFVLKLHQL